MAIAITELNVISGSQVLDSDLLILEDVSEGTTKRITFGDLTDTLLSTQAFEDNASEVISALNDYNSGDSTNQLNSARLFADGAYQTGQYFLDYGNFDNTPDIPDNLEDLTNNTGFVKLDTSVQPARLVFFNNQGGNSTFISTYNVPENTQVDDSGNLVGPLYFTNDRVEAFLDDNFASYYNLFTSTFDDGNVRDSLIGVPARFTDAALNAQDFQGSIMRIDDSQVFDNFSAGQTVRIYGADIENGLLGGDGPSATPVNSSLSITKIGFEDAQEESGHQATFSYVICEFDTVTGQIAPARSQKDVVIATPSSLIDDDGFFIVDDVYDAFSIDNFIRLNITGVAPGNGVAVYRRTPTTSNAFILTAVLGPKEVAEGQWIDYYTFDWTPWSGKLESDNTYPESVVHFPRVAPTKALRGWVDKVIESTEVIGSSKFLRLADEDFVLVSSEDVQLCHNDTQKIRQAITQNASIDKKAIVLNAKTYVSGALTVPNNFGLTGTSFITKIVKLPWSGAESGISSGNMLQTQSTSNPVNVSIVGVDFDGNALNQFLFPDNTDDSRNYAIDFGINANSPLIDKSRIRNVVGGGIYADRPVDMRINNSEVINSGISDRTTYSPLFAYGGQKTTITSNRFENFGEAIEVSNTDKGIVSDNLISGVGSGLTVYGSKFFISSQNVLTGPAGEFLATPDTLNSEFDLINIDLTSAYMAEGDYLSDVHVYQENGQVFDLTQTDGAQAQIKYSAHYVEKLPNGGEQFWTPQLAEEIVFQERSVVPQEGQFAFTIPASSVADIKNRNGSNSYTSLTQNTIDWDKLATDITRYPNNISDDDGGHVKSFFEDSLAGYVRADVNKSGSISTDDAQFVLSYADNTLVSDDVRFRIKKFLENALLDAYVSDNPQIHSDVLSRYVTPGNPNHEGIIWKASFENEVKAADIVNVITPDSNNNLEPLSSGFYHITVSNLETFLSVGAEVVLLNPGFSAEGVKGTVHSITTVPGTTTATITIKYSVGVTAGGNSGSINIVDKFVLAQGRIF